MFLFPLSAPAGFWYNNWRKGRYDGKEKKHFKNYSCRYVQAGERSVDRREAILQPPFATMRQAGFSRGGLWHCAVCGGAPELRVQGPLQGCRRWRVAEKDRLQPCRDTAWREVCALRTPRGIDAREVAGRQGGGGVRQLFALPVREDRRGVLLKALSRHRRQIHALCLRLPQAILPEMEVGYNLQSDTR